MKTPYDQAIAEIEKDCPAEFRLHRNHALDTLKGKHQGWLDCCREFLPRIPETDLTDEEIAFLEEVKK